MKLSADRIKSIKRKCEHNGGWYATQKYWYDIDLHDQRLRRTEKSNLDTAATLSDCVWEYMEGDTEPR